MSEKREFKVGDEVWYYKNFQPCVQKIEQLADKLGYITLEDTWDIVKEVNLFHTHQELLENIKQQIDELDNRG